MIINEGKYDELFINKYKVDPVQLKSEFKRVINKYGYSEEIKFEFYSQVFHKIISQFKRELVMDEKYDYNISTFYLLFIDTLEKDNIDSSKFRRDLQQFKEELSKCTSNKIFKIKESKSIYKAYNLNTKYGRRKAREQEQRHYDRLTPEEKAKHNSIIWITLIIFFLLMWLLLGTHSFIKWVTH